ncbi:MAG: hypothetical protein PHG05_04340 [Candidatus Nanoarchaeia archaeon]|nr:hypothetical protein [Candidatus Nanoarchaeia archaeon]
MERNSFEIIKLKEDLVVFLRHFDSLILVSRRGDKKYKFPPGEICVSYDYKVKKFSGVFVGRNYDHPFLMNNNEVFKFLTPIDDIISKDERFNTDEGGVEKFADNILQKAIVYLSKAPIPQQDDKPFYKNCPLSEFEFFDKYLIM